MLSHVHKVTGISAERSQNRFDTDVIGVMQIVATAAEVKIAIGCLRTVSYTHLTLPTKA
mgnify:CR=1 FL=1